MLGFLKKLLPSTGGTNETPLYFKDGQAAFEYSCRFLKTDLAAKAILPALVEDAALALGADAPVIVRPNGTQMLALRVSSSDGGFLVLSASLSSNGPKLKPGDLVAWQAGQPIERHTAELSQDQRSRWVGIVLAKLRPEYMPGRGWAIEEPFRPEP